MRTLAVMVLVFGLFAGTAAAFVVTVGLKLVPSPLGATRLEARFSPTCGCPQDNARIRFRVRVPDRLDVALVDAEERVVRMLARDERRAVGRFELRWDGRDEAGAVVSDGDYRLQVRFREARRTIVVPDPIEVDSTRPRVGIASAAPRTFSPDGDGRRDELEIAYVASEAGAPLVLVDGEVVREGRVRPRGEGAVVWDGHKDAAPLPPGDYEVSVAVRDQAGNVSLPADAVPVRIRYIELASTLTVARRGGPLRFQVATDAASFSWELRGRGGQVLLTGESERRSVTVALPRSIRPGRYELGVTAVGREARAAVRVVRGRS